MKYNCEIVIQVPRNKVIEYFDSFENMKHWQEGLISYDHLSGESGQPGAKTKLKYKTGKREIEMVETITVRNLPDEFSGTYEAKGVWNEVKNYFFENDESSTKWVTENEFIFSTIFMKMMGWLMPGAFKKQSNKYLEDFKSFAEKEYSKENENEEVSSNEDTLLSETANIMIDFLTLKTLESYSQFTPLSEQ